jgi:hypothetical protein
MSRKGIWTNYPSMLNIIPFIKYSITCPIDQDRVNELYFDFMKKMNIFNRLRDIEAWLLSKDWKKEMKKEVVHIHVLGNSNNMKMKKVPGLDRLDINVPRNDNFEIVREFEISKVNKAISYLRWVRNRYRLNNIKYDFEEAANLLKIWKYSYGIQKSIDRFIIWKYAIKCEMYPEMLFKKKLIYINGYGNRKKRRRIEVLYNAINNIQDLCKLKAGKIYNIFNRENLEHLIRKAVKKKKKEKKILYCKEEELVLCLEKVNKNWKTRRKNPDKIVKVIVSSLYIKEFNTKKEENKYQKQIRRNGKIHSGKVEGKKKINSR